MLKAPNIATGYPAMMAPIRDYPISDREFGLIRTFIYEAAGIDLAPTKKVLVTARLGKRLRHYGLQSYNDYYALVTSGSHPGERQMMVDLLTTNETYFFRESVHFELLSREILAGRKSGPFRVWSAASSSGEEAYSVSMVLADKLGLPMGLAAWEVVGSDISSRVLETARAGHYSMARTDGIPREYLKQYCLRGTGPHEGTLLIDAKLRERVRFQQVNLNRGLPDLGKFDVVFLRNVMIYFDQETKRQIVSRVLSVLKPGGHFFIGHSETLKGLAENVKIVAPATYVKA